MNDEMLIHLYNKGYRSYRLSLYFKVSQQEVIKSMVRLGLNNHRKNIDKYKDEIIDRYINGESIPKICKDYGVGMRTVYVYLQEWGVVPLWGHKYRERVLPSLKAMGRNQFKNIYETYGLNWFKERGYCTVDVEVALWYYGLSKKKRREKKYDKTRKRTLYQRCSNSNGNRHRGMRAH